MPISTIFIGTLPGPISMTAAISTLPGDGWKQALLRLWALGIVLVVLVLAGGFSGETMAHCVFQILPYLMEVGSRGQRRLGAGAADVRRRDAAGLRLQGHRSGAAGTGRAGDGAAGAGMLGTALCMIVHGTAGRLAGLLLCLC